MFNGDNTYCKKILELFENPIEEYTGGESFFGLDG